MTSEGARWALAGASTSHAGSARCLCTFVYHLADPLLVVAIMRTAPAISLAIGLAFATGCADSGPSSGPNGEEIEDVEDPDARADGTSAPGGLYEIAHVANVEDPHFPVLDLRANKTYYRTFSVLGPILDHSEDIVEIQTSYERGTFKFTRGGGNTYIRFHDGESQLGGWRYTMSGTKLEFHYKDGGGFTMKRVAPPAAAWTDAVKDAVAEASSSFPAVERNASPVTDSMRATLDAWKGRTPAPKLRRASVEGKDAFVVSGGNELEVFAPSGQLIAAGTTSGGKIAWDGAL